MLSNSELLRHKLALANPYLEAVSGAFWNHPDLRELYPEFLVNVHAITRATSPSLAVAAECARARAAHDPVSAILAAYYADHSREERGHDQWTLDDYEALGRPRSELLERMPSPAVAALVGSQYYWAYHHDPVAYMGYIAVMEGPPSIEFLEDAVVRTGFPRSAFGTQFFHAGLDHHHVREFNDTLDSLPLTLQQHSTIGLSAITTVQLLARVYEEILDSGEKVQQRTA